MRTESAKKLLTLWRENGFLSKAEETNLFVFMKKYNKNLFLRFPKWLSVIGCCFMVLGALGLLWQMMSLSPFEGIRFYILGFFSLLNEKMQELFGIMYYLPALSILFALMAAGLYWYSEHREKLFEKEKALLTDEQKTLFIRGSFLKVISYFLLDMAGAFLAYYFPGSFDEAEITLFLSCVFFVTAFLKKDLIALFFGIFSLIGVFNLISEYMFSLTREEGFFCVGHVIYGFLLTGFSFFFEKNTGKNGEWMQKVGKMFGWSGLFFMLVSFYFSLFYFSSILADIIFLFLCAGILIYGVVEGKSVYYNYGLLFFILGFYFLYFFHVMPKLNGSWNTFLLGLSLVFIGWVAKKSYLEKNFPSSGRKEAKKEGNG